MGRGMVRGYWRWTGELTMDCVSKRTFLSQLNVLHSCVYGFSGESELKLINFGFVNLIIR